MYRSSILLCIFFALSMHLQAQETQSIKLLQAYEDKQNEGIFYNMVKVSDQYFVLVKDNVPAPDSINTPSGAWAYMTSWLEKNESEKRIEGDDYFVFKFNDFNSLPQTDSISLGETALAINADIDYKIRWSTPYEAHVKINQPKLTIPLGAIIYCCTDHPPGHCDEDKEKLKTDKQCANFTIRI